MPLQANTAWRPFLRAFAAWYTQHEAQFRVRLQLTRPSSTYLEFSLEGVPSLLSVVVKQLDTCSNSSRKKNGKQTWCEINVYVTVNGENFDCIACLECMVARTRRGYECMLCDEAERPAFASPEDLWVDECFTPLLDWVNQELGKAHALQLYSDVGCTSASLVMAPEKLAGRPLVSTDEDGARIEYILLGSS